MSYDSEKDKTVYSKDLTINGNKTGIELSIRSYDGGPEKVQFMRFGHKKSGERYYIPKLGRLLPEEMTAIVAAWNDYTGK